ncbi:MAG: hypothetical protein L3J88_06435 [Gammaproteobacteria bacterium]|nr:hypothetical protein [Gammaproteobacteria bacterium]MCF6362972.1 hypothetical protein [Gammaproteobacteria bacterium]
MHSNEEIVQTKIAAHSQESQQRQTVLIHPLVSIHEQGTAVGMLYAAKGQGRVRHRQYHQRAMTVNLLSF